MEPTYSMPAEQAAEALMASMKLNGIDRLWFTSGTELAFFQEVPVKHQALGRPDAAHHDHDPRKRGALGGHGRDDDHGQAIVDGGARRVRHDQRRRLDPQRRPRPLPGADDVGLSAVGRDGQRAGRARRGDPVVPADSRPGRVGAPVHALGPQAGVVRQPGHGHHARRPGHAQRAAGPGLPGHPARGGDAPDGRRDVPTARPAAAGAQPGRRSAPSCARPRSGCSRPSGR